MKNKQEKKEKIEEGFKREFKKKWGKKEMNKLKEEEEVMRIKIREYK